MLAELTVTADKKRNSQKITTTTSWGADENFVIGKKSESIFIAVHPLHGNNEHT